jgi:hypothetical protein
MSEPCSTAHQTVAKDNSQQVDKEVKGSSHNKTYLQSDDPLPVATGTATAISAMESKTLSASGNSAVVVEVVEARRAPVKRPPVVVEVEQLVRYHHQFDCCIDKNGKVRSRCQGYDEDD